MKEQDENIENASPRPWRIEATALARKRGLKPGSLILAANGETVAVCHPDNAKLIVAAVNAVGKIATRLRVLSRDGMKPEQAAWIDKTQRIAEEAKQ